mgnify:CR=1 FL=1
MIKEAINQSSKSSTILDQELRKLSDETGIPISKLFDKAIELLLEDFKKKGLYTPK